MIAGREQEADFDLRRPRCESVNGKHFEKGDIVEGHCKPRNLGLSGSDDGWAQRSTLQKVTW